MIRLCNQHTQRSTRKPTRRGGHRLSDTTGGRKTCVVVWIVMSREDGRRGGYVFVDWTLLARIVLCSCDPPGQPLGISPFVSRIMCATLVVVSLPQTIIYQPSKLVGRSSCPPQVRAGTAFEGKSSSDIPATFSGSTS